MSSNANPAKSSRPEFSEAAEPVVVNTSNNSAQAASIAAILRAFGSSIGSDKPVAEARGSESDWFALIDTIGKTAARVREVEAQARDREAQIEALLERVRDDMRAAEERVRAAELQASQAEEAVADRIRALEERARVAEERARLAEAWLSQIHETISREFSLADEAEV